MEHMEHRLFKPRTFEEGKHEVVGDCNGFTMQERWKRETPLFAQAILSFAKTHCRILDYGCGVGRLAKGILDIDTKEVYIDGTDDSHDMRFQSSLYVNHPRYNAYPPRDLEGLYQVIYCVYVLQHVPAIEIREILARIHSHLAPEGHFIYCSSDYRMAIRFDSPAFFDDRFLGVNLQKEIERYFEPTMQLFSEEDIADHEILQRMVAGSGGGLPHPAMVYRKRDLGNKAYFDYTPKAEAAFPSPEKPEESTPPTLHTSTLTPPGARVAASEPQKLLLLNRLAPGDILVMTNVLRDLHKAYPGKYLTDVRTPCNEIFEHNPYITKLQYSESKYTVLNSMFATGKRDNEPPRNHIEMLDDVAVIDMMYPAIHQSGTSGWHFSQGHRAFLEEALGIKIPQTELRPEIYLSQAEKSWTNPLVLRKGSEYLDARYWVINAGSKSDFSLKQYPYYQEVVDILVSDIYSTLPKDVKIVQIGQRTHKHEPLKGVVDMVGETNIRELFRLIYRAEGVITCVSLPMHVAAAFSKPCVVVAGGREGTRWELYPNQQFLYVNGCLPCAPYDGCWKSGIEDCQNKRSGVPKCMTLIKPSRVAEAVGMYYDGGMLDGHVPFIEETAPKRELVGACKKRGGKRKNAERS